MKKRKNKLGKDFDLKKYLSRKAELVNSALKKYLPKDNSVISRAMRYSMLALSGYEEFYFPNLELALFFTKMIR